MRLRAWALSTSDEGARSPANSQFLDVLHRRGPIYATPRPGMTIGCDQTTEQDVACIRLHFHLPKACQSNGVRSIPVLVPSACVRRCPPQIIFYSLVEEIIRWLASVGPKHSLIRLYLNNCGDPFARLDSSGWQQLHDDFVLFITNLRHSHQQFHGPGRISGSLGVIEVTPHTRTSSGEISADYIATLTLANRLQMSLLLPRSVARLPLDWMLDWLEVQHEFSSFSSRIA